MARKRSPINILWPLSAWWRIYYYFIVILSYKIVTEKCVCVCVRVCVCMHMSVSARARMRTYLYLSVHTHLFKKAIKWQNSFYTRNKGSAKL